ncbi:MAG: hypothetical protein AMJ53_02595 [Gammaproteobacteria bacterium SG8_11]|nr:MAG: hypothetical protein AMJ53_02595 [Gammaproteobacteria bacterium SG8_11]
MDMLSDKYRGVDFNSPRDVILGPQVVRAPAYGISLVLPSGWMAATVLGELYGIEPLARKDGRIYVQSDIADVAEVIRSHAEGLDFGVVKLLPTSTPFVDKNQVSIHASVQGVGPHKLAYVSTVVTANRNAITFAAFFEEPAALFFKAVVSELADSVTDLIPH